MKHSLIIPMVGLVLLTACAGPSGNSIRLAQYRQTCAGRGFAPGSEAFEQCVASLDRDWIEDLYTGE